MQEIHVELPDPDRNRANAWISHAVPFVAWLFIMQVLGDPEGWKYAVRSFACLGLFLWLKPWVWYPKLQVRNLPLAVGVGLFVFVAWVGMETEWARTTLPWLHDVYVRYGVLPFGKPREVMDGLSPYHPEVCGWTLTLIRIAGSALVIGVIEEFFWRGFLYRWFARKNWLDFHPPLYDTVTFFMISAVFAMEHMELVGGFIAGMAYAWMYIRTKGDIWSVAIAHAITNAVLGAYVVMSGSYQYW
jgi:membrane protease YdiL (CAAX protease family)